MPGLFTRRWLLLSLAALLTFAATVYSCIWAYYIRSLPQSRIGVTFRPFSPESGQLDVIRVSTGSPAESAGLLPGDRVIAINGRPLDTIRPWGDWW